MPHNNPQATVILYRFYFKMSAEEPSVFNVPCLFAFLSSSEVLFHSTSTMAVVPPLAGCVY